MPSKFPWNRSKGPRKADQDGDHESDTSSSLRPGSTGTSLEYPDSESNQYYQSSANREHTDLIEYTQQSSYPQDFDARADNPSPYSLPRPESNLGDRYLGQYSAPPEQTITDSSTRRGFRNKFGLSSSRENISEEEDRKPRDNHHHHRDQLKSKLGFGRRASIKRKESPGSSQADLVQESRLHSIAQSQEQSLHVKDSERFAYNPSPVAPQFEPASQPHYLAYRAPASDPHNTSDYSEADLVSAESAIPQQTSNIATSQQAFPPSERRQLHTSQQYHSTAPLSAAATHKQQSNNKSIGFREQSSQQYEQQSGQGFAEPVYQPPEYKAPSVGVRRQDSVRRQTSVHRKSIHQSGSVREHRRSRSSETNLAIAPPAVADSSTPRTLPSKEKLIAQAAMPSQPQNLSRSNTQLQQPQDSEESIMRAASEMTQEDLAQLLKEHHQLREKYSKVKRYYFEKDDQVKQLQNTLAHQRLSQSRTSLDDGEYTQRFTRLDGLISQLAFSFRKDWEVVPQWLQAYVNKDAVSIGKQEMTAVGRAFISRWIADEVFDKYFSPALPSALSMELKTIQKNIRAFHPTFQTNEEEDALTAKITNWRLSTVDGLQHTLSSNEAVNNRKVLTETLVEGLIDSIQKHMSVPPAGLEGGVHMIVELAVSILGNLPFESRDVHIEYTLPGTSLDADLMKVETGIPPLISAIANENQVSDNISVLSTTDSASDIHNEDHLPAEVEKVERKGFLGGLMGDRKKATNSSSMAGASKLGSATHSQTSLAPPSSSGGLNEGPGENNLKVRMSVFLGLEIRGKMVLAKAPVYRL